MARERSAGDYAVGYGRPPVATQFKPGQSGNPKGRAKRRTTVGEDLDEVLMTKVKIVENGRTRSYTLQQVIVRNLAGEAARKNLRAALAIFALQARYGSSTETVLDPAELPPEDREILQGFIDQVRGPAGADDQRPNRWSSDTKDRPNDDSPDEIGEGGADA